MSLYSLNVDNSTGRTKNFENLYTESQSMLKLINWTQMRNNRTNHAKTHTQYRTRVVIIANSQTVSQFKTALDQPLKKKYYDW